MVYQNIRLAGGKISTMHNELNNKQPNQAMGTTTDGFDLWWNKIFAQHADMVAEASAIMSEYHADFLL